MTESPLLEVENLRVSVGQGPDTVEIVRGVSLSIERGEIIGVVGESGCGKTMTALSLMGLEDRGVRVTSDGIRFESVFLDSSDARRRIGGHGMGIVFQDPLSSLNPVLSIKTQMLEAVRSGAGNRRQRTARACELLDLVGLPTPGRLLRKYPHELSGGMRQRVMIAMALAGEPKLLIADEPTTALDVTVQNEIVVLVRKISAEMDLAVLWVTHNLALLAGLASRIIVLYAGQIVEQGSSREIYSHPQHPYTQGLLGSLPSLKSDRSAPLPMITGSPPRFGHIPKGCSFAPRCAHRMPICAAPPPTFAASQSQEAACWLLDPDHDGGARPSTPK